MMYRAVCQPDRAHGGGPLSACQQIHIFNSPPVGVLSMSTSVHVEGEEKCAEFLSRAITWISVGSNKIGMKCKKEFDATMN